MHLLFPSHPSSRAVPDEAYADEHATMLRKG